MFRKLKENNYKEESYLSYLGMIKHGQSYKIKQELLNNYLNNHEQ